MGCTKCFTFVHDYVKEIIQMKGTYTDYLRLRGLRCFADEWTIWIVHILERLPMAQFLLAQGMAATPTSHFQIFAHLLERQPWFQAECEFIRTRMIEAGVVSLKENENPFKITEYYLAETLPPILRAAYETHYYHSHPEIGASMSLRLPQTTVVAVPLQEDEDLYS